MTESSKDLDTYVRDELPRIVEMLGRSSMQELEIQAGEAALTIRRHRVQSESSLELPAESGTIQDFVFSDPEPDSRLRAVNAPQVGTFYYSEQPGRAPLIQEGSRVERGSLIGVIEALQVLTEVESDVAGVVQRLVAPDAQAVEFGQPLVEVLVDR